MLYVVIELTEYSGNGQSHTVNMWQYLGTVQNRDTFTADY